MPISPILKAKLLKNIWCHLQSFLTRVINVLAALECLQNALISKEVENNFHLIKVLFNSTKHNTIIIRK
jgi:hypothetical protein